MTSWYGGTILYLIGAVMYATATPERFFPKRFDIIGSSHQFFHMLINLALAIHFRAGYKLYLDRFDKVCPINIR